MRAWLVFLVLAACGPRQQWYTDDDTVAPDDAGTHDSMTNGPHDSTVSGMPCDVRDVIAARCVSCHSNPPTQSAPMALTRYEDLTAPSKGNPGKKIADICLDRMKNAMFPMPPAPNSPATGAEIGALQKWIASGMPKGTCGGIDAGTGGDAGNPYDTPTTCTSGTYWTNGDTGSADMHPGVACRNCHVLLGKASSKGFDIAGTVYPSAHEPDDCNGVSGVTVIITDANNVDHPFPVNGVGNFYHLDSFGFAKIAVPYHAKVVRNGMTRAMTAAQTDGNCNNCHTETGANNAPGRIMAP